MCEKMYKSENVSKLLQDDDSGILLKVEGPTDDHE